MQLVRTQWNDPEFLALAAELDAFLAVVDGHDSGHYKAFSRAESMSAVVLAQRDGRAVGCGAFRDVGEGTAELKRMYVRPSERGKGTGRAILSELESWAQEAGYRRLILETARELAAARRLYEQSGYRQTERFGAYRDSVRSVCYAKVLGPESATP